MKEGSIEPGHVRGELGELLTGSATGRTSDDEITLFRSLGLAVFDVSAAAHVLAKAEASAVGVTVDF